MGSSTCCIASLVEDDDAAMVVIGEGFLRAVCFMVVGLRETKQHEKNENAKALLYGGQTLMKIHLYG